MEERKLKDIQHRIKFGKTQKEINKGGMELAEYKGEL